MEKCAQACESFSFPVEFRGVHRSYPHTEDFSTRLRLGRNDKGTAQPVEMTGDASRSVEMTKHAPLSRNDRGHPRFISSGAHPGYCHFERSEAQSRNLVGDMLI